MEGQKRKLESYEIVGKLRKEQELLWLNPRYRPESTEPEGCEISREDIRDAADRLKRFASFIKKAFPETVPDDGLIESELKVIEGMKDWLKTRYGRDVPGKLMIKMDGDLPIAGSVKARGGIYEVLKYTEEIALKAGLLKETDSYEKLSEKQFRDFFGNYTIQVGSTGNLGLSIGIISAVMGYKVIVHMSSDAREWKKNLLRSYGVQVLEYETDYSEAVVMGRSLSDRDPMSYFVDDENSRNLFLGYAVAAERLQAQLISRGAVIDETHPLFVYLPCGVGGAPGGITYGLKQIFRKNVHCFFVEPTGAPCMVLGMGTGLHNHVCVNDIGLSGKTCADGLAVGRPSGFVGKVMDPLLSGIFTVRDEALYPYLRALMSSENIFIEPSACAAFAGVSRIGTAPEWHRYIESHHLGGVMDDGIHIAWATGGKLVPEDVREEYVKMGADK